MFVLGITGGICSGKSTVSRLIRNRGIPMIDADVLGHQTYLPGTDCFKSLTSHFGSGIVAEDGTINRKALGFIVFSDKSKMDELNSIVWPEIRKLLQVELENYRSQGVNLVVVEAAVMIEAGWYDLMNEVWVAHVHENVAIHRLMVRNALTEEQARQRVEAQISVDERRKYASVLIDNTNRSIEQLEATVNQLLLELLTRTSCTLTGLSTP